jgi:GT2 family glycosyltransferase
MNSNAPVERNQPASSTAKTTEPCPAVSIIVLNCNGLEFLHDCFTALDLQAFTDFETIMVDNASTDGSLDYIRSSWPHVQILALDKNYGFGVANNRGIEKARGRYIALLNNDTRVDRLWLAELVKTMDENPDVGMCASKIVFADEPDRVDSAGDELFIHGAVFTYRDYNAAHPAVSKPRMCFSACAGAALYRKAMLEDIGLFDPLFSPIYFEDIDLGFRAQLMGYQCMYVPTAVVLHKGSATTRRNKNQFIYLVQRNAEYVILKNMPLALYLRYVPFRIGVFLCVIIKYLPRGMALPFVKAKIDFVRNIPHILASRAEIQRKRRVSAAVITRRLFKGGWLFYRFRLHNHAIITK